MTWKNDDLSFVLTFDFTSCGRSFQQLKNDKTLLTLLTLKASGRLTRNVPEGSNHYCRTFFLWCCGDQIFLNDCEQHLEAEHHPLNKFFL